MQMVSKVVHAWGKVYESSPSLGDGSELLPNLCFTVSANGGKLYSEIGSLSKLSV